MRVNQIIFLWTTFSSILLFYGGGGVRKKDVCWTSWKVVTKRSDTRAVCHNTANQITLFPMGYQVQKWYTTTSKSEVHHCCYCLYKRGCYWLWRWKTAGVCKCNQRTRFVDFRTTTIIRKKIGLLLCTMVSGTQVK